MSITVLLVDDQDLIRNGLHALLDNAEDIDVIAEATNGHQALEKTLTLNPDVVVMDLNLPKLNGIEATRRILAASPDKRILVLSMLQEKSCVAESLRAGASGYLVKSRAAEELLLAIRTLAAGESYLCRQVINLVIEDYALADTQKTSIDKVALTPRELEVLQLIAAGHSTKEIAYRLDLSIKTIDVHRRKIMQKLDFQSITELIRHAIREDLTPIE